MAGNYPDVPSWRMAWDRDGSQFFTLDRGTNAMVEQTEATRRAWNNEVGSPVTASTFTSSTSLAWVLIFPEHRDIDAYYAQCGLTSPSITLQVSTDSTNGTDGTWTTLTSVVDNGPVIPGYRSKIQSGTALGIKAVKWWYSYPFRGASSGSETKNAVMHLFGEKVPAENLDRLEIWHPTLDQKIVPEHFDFGDSPRSSSATKTFRVKNISPLMTAQQVRVAMEIFTDSNPSLLGQMSISADGSAWLPQVNIGDLGPGQISGVLSLRREILTNAQMGVWAFRVFAESTATWV